MDYLGQGLQIAVTGILVVFAVLCLLALAMVIMSKVLGPEKKEEALEPLSVPEAQWETGQQEIAAIISAMYTVMGSNIKNIKITKRGEKT